jgi:hypothetical protein
MCIVYVVDKLRVFCTTLLECCTWSVSHTGWFISGEKAVKTYYARVWLGHIPSRSCGVDRTSSPHKKSIPGYLSYIHQFKRRTNRLLKSVLEYLMSVHLAYCSSKTLRNINVWLLWKPNDQKASALYLPVTNINNTATVLSSKENNKKTNVIQRKALKFYIFR